MKVSTLKIVAIVCAFVAIALGVISFVMPPRGVIDSSVLKWGAEVFAYNSLFMAWEAITKGYSAEVRHGDTVARIDTDDDDDEKNN